MSKRSSKGLAFLVEDRPVEAFEQLDSVLKVVALKNWFFLSLIFITLASFGIFSCLYRAPLKVTGRGIILAKYAGEGDPLLQVTAPAAGRLTQVFVTIGSKVSIGDVLAEIDQRDLRDQIKSAEADLKRLEDEDEALTRFDKDEAASRMHALEELERTLKLNLKLDQGRLTTARKIAGADKYLHSLRLLNDSDALKSRADADAVQSTIGATEARLMELNYNRLEDETRRRREKVKRGLSIVETSTKLSLLRERLDRDTKVKSAYAGTVVDLMITPHALVEKGAPAALLRPPEHGVPPMEAIVFVPAGTGKKVRIDDAVEISPDTLKRQEYGFIRGVVRSVSEIPATEMAMLAELKHKSLVSNFVQQYAGQVLLCLHVDLLEAKALPQRDGARRLNPLAWSSSSGSYQRLGTGTLCASSVVVDKRPLITLAFPWVKQLFGIY